MADGLGHVDTSENEATKIQRALRPATTTSTTTASIRRRCDLIKLCSLFNRLPNNSLGFVQFG